MKMHEIILEEIKAGRVKTAGVFTLSSDGSYGTIKQCKIVKVLQFRGTIILRLKPWNDYPLGHKFLYRSLDELF